ncbi:MAG: type II secretion system F family protein [Parasporobacterium sp.]|nr:type II secretion system F family protein [Parasporobacterium sp.]
MVWLIYRINKKEKVRARKEALRTQFSECLQSLAAALRAGFSVENALRECLSEMKTVYGEGSAIVRELEKMLNQLALGENAETVFNDFADRNDVDDIRTFAEVFSIARTSGGDMVEIIKKSAGDIAAKNDTINEINVVISAKKFEQNIMSLMPAAIILYIDLTSGGLLDPLYGNPLGVIIMTACLAVYAGAYILGRRICRIEV